MLCDITVTSNELKCTVIEGELISRLIDAISFMALLATQSSPTTVIKDAAEFRVYETARIKAVVHNYTSSGASTEEAAAEMIIHGKSSLTGGHFKSYSDHRIAMMAVIASLICERSVTLDDISSIAVSYPNFFDHVKKITNG